LQAKATAGVFRFVRMQSVLMLPGCCHSCTPIAHPALVVIFLNSNNKKRKCKMYPKFTLTYINISTLYVHKSISAQEPCICTQEKRNVDIHPHTRIHIYTIHTYKFIHNTYMHIYKCVYRMQSVLILPACCRSSTHVAKHCTDNPCVTCSRSLCGFIFEKHRTSRKSALYKEPCIRKITRHLRKRVLYLCTKEMQHKYINRDKQTLGSMCPPQHIYAHMLLKHTVCSLCKCCPHTFIVLLLMFSLFTHARRRSKQQQRQQQQQQQW